MTFCEISEEKGVIILQKLYLDFATGATSCPEGIWGNRYLSHEPSKRQKKEKINRGLGLPLSALASALTSDSHLARIWQRKKLLQKSNPLMLLNGERKINLLEFLPRPRAFHATSGRRARLPTTPSIPEQILRHGRRSLHRRDGLLERCR